MMGILLRDSIELFREVSSGQWVRHSAKSCRSIKKIMYNAIKFNSQYIVFLLVLASILTVTHHVQLILSAANYY